MTAIPKMPIKVIVWNYYERTSIVQIHLILIHWNYVWDAMLDMYRCYTPKPTNTYGGEEHCASDLS